jgi:hypothetical protein
MSGLLTESDRLAATGDCPEGAIPVIAAIRGTDVTEYRLGVARHSYRLDVRGSDYLAPLLGSLGKPT